LPHSQFASIIATVVNFPKVILLAVALGFAAAKAFAHGDVHERITQLTQQIAQSSSNAAPLYFQRAELYRIDGDFTNALADLDQVAKLDANIVRVGYCRGRVLFEANRPHEALAPLNKYLAMKPKDAEAYTIRARVLKKLGSYKASAEDYTTAIAQSTASPELFIERAEAYRGMGKPDEAIGSLEEGIRKMGPLVTLELPAIDVEVSLKRYDAALARIDAVSARLQRKETWLVRRAEILHQAGREEEARKTYREALAAIDRLPPAHQGTRAMLELQERIRAALNTNAPPGR
jgi:tetratricopeptide (TPR) repeat protein